MVEARAAGMSARAPRRHCVAMAGAWALTAVTTRPWWVVRGRGCRGKAVLRSVLHWRHGGVATVFGRGLQDGHVEVEVSFGSATRLRGTEKPVACWCEIRIQA